MFGDLFVLAALALVAVSLNHAAVYAVVAPLALLSAVRFAVMALRLIRPARHE